MTAATVARVLDGARLMPVLTVPDPATAAPPADALAAGGARCAEVTFRTPDAERVVKEMAAHGGLTIGVSDRAHTAVSQLRKGDVDWDEVFSAGVRWFHTGGIFAGLSDTTVDVADEALAAARRQGVTVSYDPNYRPSLWAGRGGAERAREVDLRLGRHADVVVSALGLAGTYPGQARVGADEVADALAAMADLLPGASVLAATLRDVPSAGVNDWSSAAWSAETGFVTGPRMPGLHVLDRIGSGDAFAAGLIHGLLTGSGLERALAYGTAHGALTMTTPGDVSMVSLAEVEALIAGGSAHVRR
ncbi:PfkB family carbohydrate kinase [Streptomyces sp. Root264]|uniref:PfkB family carbohydrate kinase n=1 Tax=Streptomyces sp. Root264 TaxID=1736503 RepID=UPI000AE65121|nr:PfkB family carbohydrate kinase [Streptomyces sp. Root264]